MKLMKNLLMTTALVAVSSMAFAQDVNVTTTEEGYTVEATDWQGNPDGTYTVNGNSQTFQREDHWQATTHTIETVGDNELQVTVTWEDTEGDYIETEVQTYNVDPDALLVVVDHVLTYPHPAITVELNNGGTVVYYESGGEYVSNDGVVLDSFC